MDPKRRKKEKAGSVVKALSREKVSALEKVQKMQHAGKFVLDKANQLIGGKVQHEQERQRAAERAAKEAAKNRQQTKTVEKGFSLGRW